MKVAVEPLKPSELPQMVEASKVIGNNDLRDKFMESQKNLKRGIVFTASLYL